MGKKEGGGPHGTVLLKQSVGKDQLKKERREWG